MRHLAVLIVSSGLGSIVRGVKESVMESVETFMNGDEDFVDKKEWLQYFRTFLHFYLLQDNFGI